MQSTDGRRKWLIAVTGAYGIVVVGYGHTSLPLGVAVPLVWANMRETDVAIALVAAVGAVGVLAAVVSFCADSGRPLWRICAWIALSAFSISAAVAVAISEILTVTAVSCVPVMGSALMLANQLMRRST